MVLLCTTLFANFNPLSLYRERPGGSSWLQSVLLFQSTLPIQGETLNRVFYLKILIFQSTLPIQGETIIWYSTSHITRISIHSPYTGRDISLPCDLICPGHFNPLSLYRERQCGIWRMGDCKHFNPLSLYRERHLSICFYLFFVAFQSTLPIQGETEFVRAHSGDICISIHSPYTGRDPMLLSPIYPICNFNPLSLYRERRCATIVAAHTPAISIHSPYTGRDLKRFETIIS